MCTFHLFFVATGLSLQLSTLTDHPYVIAPTPMAERAFACWDYGCECSRSHGCLSVVNVLCVLSSRGLCDGPIPRPEKFFSMRCVVVSELEGSRMKRPWSGLGYCATEEEEVM
jgi:hypothetical protein